MSSVTSSSSDTLSCFLHASSSSLSPDTSFEASLFSPPGGSTMMDPYFTSLEDNPEAMFDILTIQSIQERYSDTEKADIRSNKSIDTSLVSDQEFEIFVRDFPIDDSIAECFAATGDRKAPFLPVGTKSSSNTSKHNKLKKKFLPHRDGHVFSDEESKSSDSKKSKLIGNIFHRKSKSKDRTLTESKKNGDITSVIIDACENITNSYPKSESASQSSSKRKGEILDLPSEDGNKKVQRARSVTGSVSSDGVSSRKLPPLPRHQGRSKSSDSRKSSLDSRKSKTSQSPDESYWSSVFDTEDNLELISKITSWPLEKLRRLRDSNGNNILHQCVKTNKAAVAMEIVHLVPEMALDRNLEKITPIESAILNGYDTLLGKLVEPLFKIGKISVKMVSKLMAYSTENGQSECLENLLHFIPTTGGPPYDLPKGIDGTTVAHIAAARGHLNCLQVLVSNGFTRWTEDSRGFHPMQIAVQKGHVTCYHFLLMHECCTCLVREVGTNRTETERLRSQRILEQNCMESLEQRLLHHRKSISVAITTVMDTQQNISHSLDNMYTAIEGVLSKMDKKEADVLRVNLDNIKAEGERLQDLFEFSPIANSNDILSKIVKDFSTALHFEHEDQDSPEVAADEGHQLLCTISQKTKDTIDAFKNTPCDVTAIVKEQLLSLALTDEQFKSQTIVSKNTELSEQAILQEINHQSDSSILQSKVKLTEPEVERHGNSDHGSNRTVTQNVTPPSELGSVYSNTMTSGITLTNTTSDWNSHFSTVTADSNGSESDWWEDSRDSRRFDDDDDDDEHYIHDDFINFYDDDDDDDDDDNNSYNYVRLNLENEDMPDEVLREHRLRQHLKSIERLKTERSDLVETVVTATGRRLGQKDKGAFINENFNKVGPLRHLSSDVKQKPRPSVSKSKDRGKQTTSVKLFSIDDVVSSRELSQSEFLEGYDRSRERPLDDKRWDELSLTDGEDQKDFSKPWYEMSEDEESIIQSWNYEDEEARCRGFRNSYI